MSIDLIHNLVEGFLGNSFECVKVLQERLASLKKDTGRSVRFYYFRNKEKRTVEYDSGHFFLRTSVEYSNPQLTVEEVQGIVAVRILEACGHFFRGRTVEEIDARDVSEICELLRKPSYDVVVPFLLNADDVEPDRYSMNPLRSSILASGQSSFPAFSVNTEELGIDEEFLSKYEGMLISKNEAELIGDLLGSTSESYVDLVDKVKYNQLEELSELFGIDLCIPSLRFPLEVLASEDENGVIKSMIEESHGGYDSVERIYNLMGRSMKKRRTLLTVPHSSKGFGSKRAARGRLYFDNGSLVKVKVKYKTTRLYPNAIDPEDVSVAKGEDVFTVDGKNLVDYMYSETPSTPQFLLYSLASPEDACLWHAVGAYGAGELVKSYTSAHLACTRGKIFKKLVDDSRLVARVPVQFNLPPGGLWAHPIHDNIDTSIGCVENPKELLKRGIRIELLPTEEYVRR